MSSNPGQDPLQEDLLAESRAAYQREAVERRRLHNLVQELRGNIRVRVAHVPRLHKKLGSSVLYGYIGARQCLQLHSKCMLTLDEQGHANSALILQWAHKNHNCRVACVVSCSTQSMQIICVQVYVRAKPLTVAERAAGLAAVVRCESDHRVSLTFQGAPKVHCLPAVLHQLRVESCPLDAVTA